MPETLDLSLLTAEEKQIAAHAMNCLSVMPESVDAHDKLALLHALTEIRKVLREHEWDGIINTDNQNEAPCCPACMAVKGRDDHDGDCWLAALLAEEKTT